jgi:ABC-type dipeptide/oligopeptide/nickel transport system permease component
MRDFAAAAGRRLLLLLLTVAGAAVFSVLLVRLAPGLGLDERQLDLRLNESSVAALSEQPTPHAWEYLVGRWGDSLSLRRPVWELVSERAATTVRTLIAGLSLAWAISAFLCIASAWFRRRLPVDLLTGALLCLPAAVIALLAMHLQAGPTLALAVILIPRIARYMHNLLCAGSAKPHVLAARSRGLSTAAIVLRHLCVPSMPELLALAGISVSIAAGAIIPVETLCDSPGLGQLVWQCAIARDLPVLVPLTMLAASIVCAANLLADAGRTLVCRWT